MIYDKLKNIALYGIVGAFALGILWLTLKFALPIALPFILAYALSYALRLGAAKLRRSTNMNENILRGVLLLLGTGAIILFLWFAASAVFRELQEALSSLSASLESEGSINRFLDKAIDVLGERLGLSEEIRASAADIILSAGGQIGSFAAGLGGKIFSSLPKVFFGSAIGILSLFYFTFGYEKAAAAIKGMLPERHRDSVCLGARNAVRGIGRFAKSYLILMGITATEVLIGFLILRVDHAVVLALFISLVDVFPVLGVGTVLFPWAAFSLLSGDVYRAAGLIIILAAVSILRHPIESRLIGHSAGVHPVIALIAIYAGYFISGVFGMIAAPIVLGVAVSVRDESASSKHSGSFKEKTV